MIEKVDLHYDGKIAADGRLSLYDFAESLHGAARVYGILGHYCQTGTVIHKAPKSLATVEVVAAEVGSFRQQLLVGVVTSVMAVPVTVFTQRMMDQWFPAPNAEMKEIAELLREQNQLLKKALGTSPQQAEIEVNEKKKADEFIREHAHECHVLRSILSNSIQGMFRPVGRSCEYLALTHGEDRAPVAVLDAEAVRRLESSKIDEEDSVVVGVVNGFSRSSKSGLLFAPELGRGMLFQVDHKGALPPGDDYSWSQYSRGLLELRGRYIRFFDGSVKRFLVFECRRADGSGESAPTMNVDDDF